MTFGEPGCFTFSHVHHSSLSVLHMSLRTRLDRYCMQRATTTDLPFSPSRSRSPTRAPPSSSTGPSPFHRPPDGNRLPLYLIDLLFCKLTSSQCNNLPIEIHTIISWPRKSLATLLPMNTTAYSKPTRLSIQITQHDTMLVRSKLWLWTSWRSVGPSSSTLRTYISRWTPKRATKCWINLDTRFQLVLSCLENSSTS